MFRTKLEFGLEHTLEHLEGGFLMMNREWCLTFVNATTASAASMQRHEMEGRNIWELFPHLAGTRIGEYYRLAMHNGTTSHFLEQSEMSGRWYEGSIFPTQDGVAGHFNDVTARKTAEQALLESESRMRVIAQAGSTGLFEWEPLSGRMYWSDQNFRTLGYRVGEVTPSYDAWASRVHKHDIARVEEKVKWAQEHRQSFHDTHRIVWPNGESHVMEARASFEYNASGECTRMSGTYVDVTERAEAEAAVQETELRFRLMADGIPHLIWVSDAEGRVQFANRAYQEFFGISTESLLEWQMPLHPDDGDFAVALAQSAQDGAAFRGEARMRRADGEWRWLELQAAPRRGTDGEFVGHVGTSVDISDRKLAEARERDASVQAHFQSLFESLPGPYVVVTADGYHVVAVSDAYLAATSSIRETLIGRPFFQSELREPDDDSTRTTRQEIMASFDRVVALRVPDAIAMHPLMGRARGAGQEPQERWWSRVSAPVVDARDEVKFIIHRAEDVTDYVAAMHPDRPQLQASPEQHRLQRLASEVVLRAQELTLSNDRLRANEQQLRAEVAERFRLEEIRRELLRQLVSAQEAERRRVARDLHDSLGQHLTALGLRLHSLANDGGLDAPVKLQISALQSLATLIDGEVHRLALMLRPAVLDDLGLEAAIRRHVTEWEQESTVTTDIHTRFVRLRLQEEVEINVYRIVQEALNNVQRHAGASRASVVVECTEHELIAVVEDDGKGFDVVQMQTGSRTGRLGLATMAERAALMGGTLEIESSNVGTTVFLRLPLHD